MRKLHLFLCLSICFSFLGMSSYGQFNYGYYGNDQTNVNAGKLITHNPSKGILAILETNPKDAVTYDFSITMTDENGVYLTHVSFLNRSKDLGYYLKLEPTNFLYLPSVDGFIITGNATMERPQVGTYSTVFSMHLDAGLNATMLYVHTGWPFYTIEDIHTKELRTYSATLYENLGKEEVMLYAQMNPFRDPKAAEIALIHLDAGAVPYAIHRVDMPGAYNGRLSSMQTSSIDVADKGDRLLATGWANPSASNTPFILDFTVQQSTISPTGTLHNYHQNNLQEVGNTKYYRKNPAQRNNFIYFTYSHLTPNGSTSCQLNQYDGVKLLALDVATMAPVTAREITVPCYLKSIFRPYLFDHQSSEMIRIGFTQHEIQTGQMTTLAYESNISIVGSSRLYRYNFLERTHYAFRSAMVYYNSSIRDMSTLLNFTDFSGNFKSHLVGALSPSLRSYCTEDVKVEDPNVQVRYSRLGAKIIKEDIKYQRIEPKYEFPIYNYTDCGFYRPEASNSIAEMSTESTFSIFPNPVSNNQITIQGDIQQGDHIAIINATGQLIFRQELKNAQQTTIELPQSLAAGIYMVQISNNNTVRHTDKLYILK